jgi:hypothetical protein
MTVLTFVTFESSFQAWRATAMPPGLDAWKDFFTIGSDGVWKEVFSSDAACVSIGYSFETIQTRDSLVMRGPAM